MNILLAIVGLPIALVLPGLVTMVAFAPRFVVGDLSPSRRAQAQSAKHLDWLEWLYLTLALSLVLSGWVGLVLAQLGIFSAGLLVGLLAVYTLVVGFVGWRRGRWESLVGARYFRGIRTGLLGPRAVFHRRGRRGRREKIIENRLDIGTPTETSAPSAVQRPLLVQSLSTGQLWRWTKSNTSSLLFLLLSLVFIALAFRPFELILGPRDAAVYPAAAAQIARHGGIRITDPILETLPDPALSDENNRLWTSLILIQSAGRFYYHYLRMPGFFIAEADVDRQVAIPEFIPEVEGEVVVPQFYSSTPLGWRSPLAWWGSSSAC